MVLLDSVIINCIVCGKDSVVSKQSAYKAKRIGGYKHPICAKNKNKTPEKVQEVYLKTIQNGWKSAKHKVCQEWLTDLNAFPTWFYNTFGITKSPRFQRIDNRKAWSPENIRVYESRFLN